MMTPKVLKALRSLYKKNIFFVEGIINSNSQRVDTRAINKRVQTQKICNKRGYCYEDHNGHLNLHDDGAGSEELADMVMDHLDSIPGIQSDRIFNWKLIVKETQ